MASGGELRDEPVQVVIDIFGILEDKMRSQKNEQMYLHKCLQLMQEEAESRYHLLMRQKEKTREAQESMRQKEQEEKREAEEDVKRRLALAKVKEAVRQQEIRSLKALLRIGRMLRQKDDTIRTLRQRLGTQEGETAEEERTTDSEHSGEESDVEHLERMEKVELHPQRAILNVVPSLHAALQALEHPQYKRASLAGVDSPSTSSTREPPETEGAAAGGGEKLPPPESPLPRKKVPQSTRTSSASTASSAASAREAPETEGAAAGGGEAPPPPEAVPGPSLASSQSITATSDALLHVADDEDEWEKRRVVLRLREVMKRMEEARNYPSALGKKLRDAAEEGRLYAVRHLLDSGANVNYVDERSFTPLLKAVLSARLKVVSLLLERGADVNAVDCNGYSSLHWCAMLTRCQPCVDLLLDAEECDINLRNKDGETPLHFAAMNGNERVVQTLMAANARTDIKGWRGSCRNKTASNVAKSQDIRNFLRS